MAAGGEMVMIRLADLIPTTDNPRTIRSKDAAIKELAESIKAYGVLQPVIARPHPKKEGKYDLRAGARRHAAAGVAGLTEIPTIVRDMDDRAAVEITVTENLQREDLTPMEEAKGVQALLDQGWTAEDVSAQIGKSAKWVVRRARLTHLSKGWLERVECLDSPVSGWPVSTLEQIARLDEGVQEDILGEDPCWIDNEGLSPGEMALIIEDYTRELSAAPWDLEDEALYAGPCSACPRRSSARPLLFDDMDDGDEGKGKKKDHCLDPRCWSEKALAFVRAKVADLEATHGVVVFFSNRHSDFHLPEELRGKTVVPYEWERCKKSEQGATPCLWVDGPKVGSWFWGKKRGARRGGSDEDGGLRTKGKKEEVPGNPDIRRDIAEAVADAWLAMVGARTAGDHGLACALWSLARNRAYQGRTTTEAREGLLTELGIGPEAVPAGLDAGAGEPPHERLAALGLFDFLQARRWAEEWGDEPPAGWIASEEQVKEAAGEFEIWRGWLEQHMKPDLVIIAGELGVKVSKSMKRDAVIDTILDAKLPAGTLTKDLAAAFGVSYKKPKGEG